MGTYFLEVREVKVEQVFALRYRRGQCTASMYFRYRGPVYRSFKA
jgi:hypothetical protein